MDEAPAHVAPAPGLWPMTQESRDKTVARLAANLAAISFFSSDESKSFPSTEASQIEDEASKEHALVIEREAFSLADAKFAESGHSISSQTEAVLEYARRASAGMLALLQAKVIAPTQARDHVTRDVTNLELDLSLENKREFLEKERAEELLKPMLENEPNMHRKVKLSSKCFRPAAAQVAAQALRKAAGTLTHADLSDIIAGQPQDEALASLSEISAALSDVPLQYLDLSNNALGEKGIRACAAVLSTQRGLESLYFCNDGISAGASAAIVELIPEESTGTLTTLHFHNNCTEDEGATALAGFIQACAKARLRNFRFSSTRVGSDGGVALAEALAAGSSLERLDMRDNMFGEEGALALAKAVQRHAGLLEVYLGDTSLGNDGACAVAEALAASCPSLEVLDLGGNEITPKGAQRLAACLASLPKLKSLQLPLNELQDEGVKIICNAVVEHNKELKELDFCTNEVGDAGALAAAEAACNLPNLETLQLNGNSISKAAVLKIQALLTADCPRGASVLGSMDENDDGEDEDYD